MSKKAAPQLPAIKNLYEIAVYSMWPSCDVARAELISNPIWAEIKSGLPLKTRVNELSGTDFRQYLLFLSLMIADLPVSPFGIHSAQDEIIMI